MKNIYFLLAIYATFMSCEKVDESPANYFPLAVGNYWVYGHFWANSQSENPAPFAFDSIAISRDTLINGIKYYVIEGCQFFFNGEWRIIDIVRDSSGYIINHEGATLFSATNFSDILHNEVVFFDNPQDTFYVINYKMERPNFKVNVPAGSFNVLNYKGTVAENYSLPTQWISLINSVLDNYFAPNVGKIQDGYLYVIGYSNTPVNRRLLRYSVKKKISL